MEIKDVKRDGNCLLWAVIISYLEQVKNNEEQFKKRYEILFGRKKGWKRIFNFTSFNFDDNKNQNKPWKISLDNKKILTEKYKKIFNW